MLSSTTQHSIFEPSSLEELKIGDQEVHLWFGSCEDLYPYLSKMSCTLSETERKRADKYKFPEDRCRCLIRIGVLRALISIYISIDPEKIRFSTNQYGKLFIENTLRDKLLEFNLSHSKDMIMYAFTFGRYVGVDIELMRPIQEMDDIVKNNFSPNEQLEYNSLSVNKRLGAFYRGWTQKEAFVKAMGDGMSRRLDQFDVYLLSDESAGLKGAAWSEAEANRWTLKVMQSPPGYSASIAVEGTGLMFKPMELTPGLLESLSKFKSIRF